MESFLNFFRRPQPRSYRRHPPTLDTEAILAEMEQIRLAQELDRIDLFSTQPAAQETCPLFQRLPPEIRLQVYAYALTDYPDPSPENRYREQTCYTRPSYFAPRRSDVALLRACRAIYFECWHMPFLLREQTHWLTAPDRAPPEYSVHAAQTRLRQRLNRIRRQLRAIDEAAKPPAAGTAGEPSSGTGSEAGETDDEEDASHLDHAMVINSLRIFTQMYVLEGGGLANLLITPYLFPRRLVITIRHADWWFWEDDEPLRFEGNWLQGVSRALPSCVREVCIELESLERKKNQVNAIAQQMCARWFFKTGDESVTLYADASPWGVDEQTGSAVLPPARSVEITRWSGTSTWHGKRWVRDETAEGQIDYYVAAVTFRPEAVLLRSGGMVSVEARQGAENNDYDQNRLRLRGTIPSDTGPDSENQYDSSDGSEGGSDEEEEEEEDDEEDDEDSDDESENGG